MGALSEVTSRMNAVATMGNSILSQALAAISTLGSYQPPSMGQIPYTSPGTFTPDAISAPSPPVGRPLPSPPGVSPIQVPSFPTPPGLDFPNEPDALDITVPDPPTIHEYQIDAFPTAPSLYSLVIPQAPQVDWNSFAITPPDPLVIDPQQYSFYIDDILILDDPMVQAIMTRIMNNVRYGGTGLTAAIEDAIWERDKERNEQQLEDSTDKLMQAWAKRGFTLPDGMLAHSVSEIQKEYMNKMLDRTREIAIKQAELEQSNIFKSMEIGTTLVFKLIEELIRYEELFLRTLEDTAKYGNEYVDLTIKAHNSLLEVYKTRAQVYEIEMRANLAQIEVYKAQIQAEMAKAGINEQAVKIWLGQIEGIIAKAKGQNEVNEIIERAYVALVQGLSARAGIYESLWKGYGEAVRAVAAKAEVYRYEVEACKAQAETNIAVAQQETATMSAWIAYAREAVGMYQADVANYKAQGDVAVSIAEVNNKAGEALINIAIEKNKIAVSTAQVIASHLNSLGTTMEAAAATAATAAAHMAGGAMAAAHAQASMSYAEQATIEA